MRVYERAAALSYYFLFSLFPALLFLVALLLPTVLWREAGRWVAAQAFGPVFWDVLKVVTGFTVAHSITLSVAALGLVALVVARFAPNGLLGLWRRLRRPSQASGAAVN